MRQRVPLPTEMKPVRTSDHLEFHELHAMLEHWLFNLDRIPRPKGLTRALDGPCRRWSFRPIGWMRPRKFGEEVERVWVGFVGTRGHCS